MADRSEDILEELKSISFQLQDLNSIRHGEYEPPKGADKSNRHVHATPDDIYSSLTTVVALLERQNQMIFHLMEEVTGKTDV